RTPDVRRAIDWYVSLGFTETSRYEEAGVIYWAMLSFGTAELMLNMGPAAENPPGALWFYVDRVKAMYEVLRSLQLQAAHSNRHAVEFVQHLYEPPYGGWEFTIRDLNGVALNFLGSERSNP